MEFTVVTSFHPKGLEVYGQRFIDSFLERWPKEIRLRIYAEDCWPNIPPEHHDRVDILDLHYQCPELVAFKGRHILFPERNGFTGKGYNFRMDAVRFANKSFAVMHAAKTLKDCQYLIWCDADVYTHTPIPYSFIKMLMPDWCDIAWLDRVKMYPECGFYIVNLHNPNIHQMFEFWRRVYVTDDLFKHCKEWHDSWVFQQLVQTALLAKWIKVSSISGGGYKTSHPFINGPLGKYMDHLKGDRKETGRSDLKEKTVGEKKGYWSA
jgi:hypothetical protein